MSEEGNSTESEGITENPEIQAAIEQAQKAAEVAEEKQKAASTSAKDALKSLSQVEEAASKAETAADSSKENSEAIKALLPHAKADREVILELLKTARSDSETLSDLASIADEKDNKISEYENSLESLRVEYESIKNKIEYLLPAATTAGLAIAFSERKTAFRLRLVFSLCLLILSISGFIGLGIWAILYEDIKTLSEFVLFALERSPIIVGLILLEEFARRLYQHTIRVEEDYGYKETVSRAFDGYEKAMKADAGSLQVLRKNVLEAINERPGRLYETEKEDKLPTGSILLPGIQPTPESSENLIFSIYDQLTKHLKGTVVKTVLVISLSIIIGILIRHYLWIAN